MTADERRDEGADRRVRERRQLPRVADLTLPELRRIIVTSLLFVVVLVLFLWMVRTVLIAAIVALIAGVYLRPIYAWLERRIRLPTIAAAITIATVVLPVTAAIGYSYEELSEAAEELREDREEVAAAIQRALDRIAWLDADAVADEIGQALLAASNYGTRITGAVRDALVEVGIGIAIFIFTFGYLLTDRDAITAYLRAKIPPRYGELVTALERNVKGVLYGAIFATLVTQTIKSVVILVLNLAFDVPLAVVLAMASFVIGFFPIVGSWSVYVPVALWLGVFQDNWAGAVIVASVGFLFNTVLMSLYVRPKLAAERSGVLNFYWMFVGLVTGVYTFGLVGIILGPVVIGMLKAVLDTVTATGSWRLLDADADDAPPAAPLIGGPTP